MSWSHIARALTATAVATSVLAAPAAAVPNRVALPTVAIGDVTVAEGSSGARTARFTVTLSEASATEVTMRYGTADSTAVAASDYVAANGTARIPAGALAATVYVSVRGDTTVEPTETFRVKLWSPTGATLGRATGFGKILNDDPPQTGLRVAAGAATIVEGNGGTRSALLPVTLSAPAPAKVTVDWSTVAGTATDGVDYTASTGRLTFAAGGTAAYATVPIIGDTQFEPAETLTVKLATPTGGAQVERAKGIVTITNDDPEPPPPSFAGKLAAGALHTCAVVAGGGVKCWGLNNDGQLGNGTRNTAYVPVPVTGLSGVVAVTAGRAHTCALLADTTVRCWGINENLELGLGDPSQPDRATDRLTPVAVPGLTGVVSIDAGGHHTCAVVTGGTVKCWGEGYNGRLGIPGNDDVASPTTIGGFAGAVQISAGDQHTCGRWSDGTLKCTGFNFSGQLGDGTKVDRSTPVPVLGISGASTVEAGYFHTCAIVANVPRCFGLNYYGALGDGTEEDKSTSVAMTGVTSAAKVSLGEYHSCVTLTSGAGRCVGFNGTQEGRLGNDSYVQKELTSVPVIGLTGATVIESGVYHTCAVVTGGAVQCWGANAAGQLGDSTSSPRRKPVTVPGLTIG